MPAIDFNNRSAIYYGGAALNRIYCGGSLVWSKSRGLPYSTNCPPPEGQSPESSGGWTVELGNFRSGVLNGQNCTIGIGVSNLATHDTIEALDVTLAAKITIMQESGYAQLRARVNGSNYYAVEYGLSGGFNFIRIIKVLSGVRSVLSSTQLTLAYTSTVSFTVKNDSISIVRGTFSTSAVDAAIQHSGKVGIWAFDAGVSTFSADHAT